MISFLESRILDANSEAMGVSVDELMGNAGEALAEIVLSVAPEDAKILFVCGTGNNGGDGYAAARLIDGCHVVCTGEPKSPAARHYASILGKPVGNVDDVDFSYYDLIVDCILGTGFSGKPREGVERVLESLNGCDALLVSADIPSAFGTEYAIVPDATVTFHDMKEGMDVDNSGTIFIADIGIPDEAWGYVGPGDFLRYPIPETGSHKGRNGRLLIIGGGPYVGAPAMAAMGALRVGADLVTVATPSVSFVPVASMSPAYMVRDLGGKIFNADSFANLPDRGTYDAVLIGPGIGKDPDTFSAVREFIRKCKVPVVVDADGIDALAGSDIKAAVVTPHAREMERLHGKGPKAADEYAKKTGGVVLLKGPVDYVTDGEKHRKNDTGNAAMTVGGTGDVLAGVVAGLLSKGMSPFDAACLAAYVVGYAGDLAFGSLSYGLTAPDVADAVAMVLSAGLRC